MVSRQRVNATHEGTGHRRRMAGHSRGPARTRVLRASFGPRERDSTDHSGTEAHATCVCVGSSRMPIDRIESSAIATFWFQVTTPAWFDVKVKICTKFVPWVHEAFWSYTSTSYCVFGSRFLIDAWMLTSPLCIGSNVNLPLTPWADRLSNVAFFLSL